MERVTSSALISSQTVLCIFNLLRDIGLNTSHKGTKYINKAVQIVILSDNELINLNNIYTLISDYYHNVTPKQIKNSITYALDSRNKTKSKLNFEKNFNFKYDEYYFTNKIIVEEIARVIQLKQN